jgi:hypothetical protein
MAFFKFFKKTFPFFSNDETAIAKFWENRTSLLIGGICLCGIFGGSRQKHEREKTMGTKSSKSAKPGKILYPSSFCHHSTIIF